jgi:hypothetical protein
LALKEQEDYTYTNKYSNKTITFTPTLDGSVVLAFTPTETETDIISQLNQKLPIDSVIAIDSNKGFAIVKLDQEGSNSKKKNISLLRQAQESSIINDYFPATTDDEGLTRYFLPGELTLKFKREIPEKSCERIIAEQGSSIITKQRTHGLYRISIPEGK